MAESWMIDELAHAGPEHLDPAFVAGYDRKQGYPDPAEDLNAFAAHGLDASSTVVDLGAGSGQFALAAARRFGHVTAVDVSSVMLAVLRQRAAAAGLGNLDCVRAGFLSYQHQGPPADGVHTRNALHQLPDFWKALALDRIARMLRPGGVLRLRDLIYDFRPADAEDIFQDWFDHAAADPADGYTGADYAEHIRTEFSTFRWLLEPMLSAAGFEIVAVEFERRLYGAYTCVKRALDGLLQSARPDIDASAHSCRAAVVTQVTRVTSVRWRPGAGLSWLRQRTVGLARSNLAGGSDGG